MSDQPSTLLDAATRERLLENYRQHQDGTFRGQLERNGLADDPATGYAAALRTIEVQAAMIEGLEARLTAAWIEMGCSRDRIVEKLQEIDALARERAKKGGAE